MTSPTVKKHMPPILVHRHTSWCKETVISRLEERFVCSCVRARDRVRCCVADGVMFCCEAAGREEEYPLALHADQRRCLNDTLVRFAVVVQKFSTAKCQRDPICLDRLHDDGRGDNGWNCADRSVKTGFRHSTGNSLVLPQAPPCPIALPSYQDGLTVVSNQNMRGDIHTTLYTMYRRPWSL